jgi:hypothetical protein
LETLLAAQVALSGLDGNVPKKKLNLFELTSGLVAQTSTRSAQMLAVPKHEIQDQPTLGSRSIESVRLLTIC